MIQLGEYGVHFVPAPPDTALLKARAEDPLTLTRILHRTDWEGVVILDTKSDLEGLTNNALHASDRVVIPVADRASLEEARKSFALFERERLDRERARVLFTLVDRRTRAVRRRHRGQRLACRCACGDRFGTEPTEPTERCCWSQVRPSMNAAWALRRDIGQV